MRPYMHDYIKCNSKESYKIANNENFADIYTDDMLSTAVYQPLSSLQVRHKQIPHNYKSNFDPARHKASCVLA